MFERKKSLEVQPRGKTKKAYSIRDAKAESFNLPFWAHTHGEAERNFDRLVNDKQSQVFQYPEDYDLYFIGEYDEDNGILIPIETPMHLVKAVQLLKQ